MASPQFPPDALSLVCERGLRLADVHENICKEPEARLTPQRWRGPPRELPAKAASHEEDAASSEQPRRGQDAWQEDDNEDEDKCWNAPAPSSAPSDPGQREAATHWWNR